MSGPDLPRSRAAFERLSASPARLAVWWRDDDARVATPALARLLALRARFDVPSSLAAIPQGSGSSLVGCLPADGSVRLLLHGFAHLNHAPEGEKRAEFGDHRPVETMLGEVRAGLERLDDLAGEHLLPVFVPPWNRIGAGICERLAEAGIAALSTFREKRAPAHPRLDTHLDLMDWRAMRGLPVEEADARLAMLVEARLGDDWETAEPIGLLTHHLQHDEAAWALTEALLAFLVRQERVDFLDAATLLSRMVQPSQTSSRREGVAS
ncbi:polysaccharide deacetylase family protein [Aurantimonas sp. Leaf443]|uniref:polysaccharide deacetylase family protein n=1 Tax=Aurantimonas sp. Leaf443 TaxID=1736378 RepID=UPI0006F67EBE|nr:polysaccharide deacetylase family protein [Aurantimonas sp. Leaf443]KQT86137.1 hypothetical protein ASG48_06040 [Aurantimonas sp. Leaf443]